MNEERLLRLYQIAASTETVGDLLASGVSLSDLEAADLLNVSEDLPNTDACFPPSCLVPPADADLIVF